MRSFVDSRHLLAFSLVTLVASSAWAQEVESEMPPPPPPQMKPQYQAPLSQTTQSTYVPQSVALSGPEEIDNFDKTRPIPDGYTLVHRTRKGLLIGGGVTLGVVYGISLLTAAIGEDTRDTDYYTGEKSRNTVAAMAIPVAGPFIQIADPSTTSATAKVFLVAVGGAQVAGAIMLYYGLTTKKQVLVRNDLVGSLGVSPYATHDSQGLAVTGRF